MKTRLLYFLELLRTSYWVVPSTMIFISVVFAMTIIELDRTVGYPNFLREWAYSGGPEGARAVLETIASSMITVAGMVFSITIVALSLASSQFGPGLLRNFIRDRINQFILGTFVSTFVYCVLVMRTIRVGNGEFVPQMGVACGVLLGLLSLAVLIYFIHHVAVSIQADRVIRAVSDEMTASIEYLFPEGEEQSAPSDTSSSTELPKTDGADLSAVATGYLSAISFEKLVEVAKRKDLLIRLSVRAGHFIVRGVPLCRIYPKHRFNSEVESELAGCFIIGSQRTAFQDVEFTVAQLVEVAVRALSPGLNDPFTAVKCIDHLGAGLCRLAQRPSPPIEEYDSEGKLRLVRYPVTFPMVTDAALNQIRQYGRSSAAVTLRLLDMLSVLGMYVRRADDRAAVERHAALVLESAMIGLKQEAEREEARTRFAKVLESGRYPESDAPRTFFAAD